MATSIRRLSSLNGTLTTVARMSFCLVPLFPQTTVKAAAHGAPIQKQRNVEKWVHLEIEKAAGIKPTQRQIKDELATALSLGRLRYVSGHGKQHAGYFPMETDPDAMRRFGIDTARESRTVEAT